MQLDQGDGLNSVGIQLGNSDKAGTSYGKCLRSKRWTMTLEKMEVSAWWLSYKIWIIRKLHLDAFGPPDAIASTGY